jgi:PAS domain S-box-containing protein
MRENNSSSVVDYKDILFNLPVGAMAVDIDGNIIFVNQLLLEILGSPSEEDTRSINIFNYEPLQKVGISKLVKRCMKKNIATIKEISYRSKWGKDIIFKCHVIPSPDEKGNVKSCFAVVQDISKQKEAEKLLTEQLNIEKIIAQISTDFIGLEQDELDTAINNALKTLGIALGAKRGHLFQVLKEGYFTRTHKWINSGPDTYPPEANIIPIDIISWFSPLIQKKRVLFLADNSRIPEKAVNECELIKKINIDSTIFIAIIDHERFTGFIALGSVDRTKWSKEYLQMLEFVGEIFVNALERRSTTIELRKKEDKYRRIFNELHDVYCETDLQNNITTISPSVKTHFGYEPDELLGKSIKILYANEHEHYNLFNLLMNNSKVNDFDMEMKRKDESLLNTSLSVHLVYDHDGNPDMIAGTMRDITEKKKAEMALCNAKRLAEEASRTKSEFLANMSHELRTPLNSVIGFSDILLEAEVGPLNEKQGRYISNISTSGKHLLDLINDILDISKIEAGEMYLNLEEFSISELISNVVNNTIPLAMKKNIEITSKTETAIVTADKSKIKQILYNLLSNAIKFTHENGFINISTEHSEGMIYVCVEDSGIGIKKEDIDKLFQPFKQIDSFYTRKYEGTGLGLALVKQLVEMHGGSIKVESEVENGSRFTFSFPEYTT